MVRVELAKGSGGNSVKIKQLLLDVLKPHQPSIIELSRAIASVNGVSKVIIETVEIDQDTESVKIEVRGNDIDIDELMRKIREMGASIHSVDSVTAET